jgi:hypothetical protein
VAGLDVLGGFFGRVRLIRVFDAKSILTPCAECKGLATRWSLYQGAINLSPWCDACDPSGHRPTSGKIVVVERYTQALDYVSMYCGSRKGSVRALIKALARAKGLPVRVRDRDTMAFFRVA